MKSGLGLLTILPLLLGCATEQSSEDALRNHGYSQAYISGYHSGCVSGKHAAGDLFSNRERDSRAYQTDQDYRTGWDFGFVGCRDKESRNLAIASAVGAGLASSHGSDGIDTRKMMQGIDTSSIKAAGW